MAKRMAIRVKLLDKSEYVEVNEEMLSNSEAFLRNVLKTFEIDEIARAFIFDQDNFRISTDLFPVGIPSFINPAVYLKIVFHLREHTGFDLALEDYLKHNGCKSIFMLAEAACAANKDLDLKSIQLLAEKSVCFLEYREEHGDTIDPQEIADSLVRLMPCIKMENLYMHKKGALFQKLFYSKYGNRPNKKKNTEKNKNGIDVETNNTLTEVVNQMKELTVAEELKYLLFFKTCLLDRDKEILKIKLEQSIKLREATIRKKETKFAESFPFYFVSPDLILFDHKIRFGNDNALIDIFPALKMQIFNVLGRADADECTNLGFDTDTTLFLTVFGKDNFILRYLVKDKIR